MDKNSLVVKSNALIETSYRLTTNEQRIILSCISQIRNDGPVTDKTMYTITAAEFSDVCGTNIKTSYRELKSAAIKLKRREVRITQEPNGKGRRKKTLIAGWVQSIEYSEGAGKVSLRFNHDILPYLSELNKCFTSYKLGNVTRMSSTYGARIYEILLQWGDMGERETSVDWLRKTLQLEKKYKQMCDLKKRVLDPAVKDINQNSDLFVEWEQRKSGRKVTHLKFKFGLKSKQTKHKSLKPKVLRINKSIIEKNAHPGESYEEAENRIMKTRLLEE